jgi:hypothetical protein
MNNRYRVAREAGLCGVCHKPFAGPGASCDACKAAKREEREFRKRAGICSRCKDPVFEDNSTCERHLLTDRLKRRKRSAELREARCCTTCGKPARKYRCFRCQRAHLRKNKDRRLLAKIRGFCSACSSLPAVAGGRCEPCRARRSRQPRTEAAIANDRARAKRFREDRIARRLCYRCGDPQLMRGLKTCRKCNEKQRIRNLIQSTKASHKRAVERSLVGSVACATAG